MFLRRGCSVGKVGKLSIPVLLWALAFIWKQPWVCKHCDWCQALFSCWETESSVVFPENVEPTVSHCCDRTMFGDVIIGFHKSAAHFLLGFSGPMHPMGSTALDQTQNSPQEARSLKGWMVWVDHLSYSLTQAATSLLCVVSSSPRGNRAQLKQAHPVWWVESGKLCGVCFANEKRFPVEARSGFSIEVWDLQPRNCS